MARFMKYAIAMLFAILAISGCGKSLLIEEAQMPEPPVQKGPIGYVPVGEGLVDVIFDDGSKEEVEWKFNLEAQDTINVAGTEPIKAAEELAKQAEDSLSFAYNYGISNTVKANIVVEYRYNGESYKLRCLEPEMMTVNGSHSTKEEETTPAYYELSETVYTLNFSGIELASATQLFEVEEGYVPPVFERVEWSYAHEAFRRAAGVAEGIITVVCDNIADFADIYSDGSKQNVEEVDYTVSNKFDFNAPAMKVDELSTVVGKTFTFSDGTVNVAGQTVSAVWKSAAVDGKVMHNGKDYASEITPCKVEAKTITFVSANQAVVKFYDKDANDYAEATVAVSVSEKEATFERVEWSYAHEAFRRAAGVAEGIITVVCDNIADFADIYSDGSKQNVEEVDYTVSNKFDFNAPAMKVDELSTVVGKTFTFSDGTVNVAGQTVSAVWKSAAVDGKVMHNGKDYASEITPCKVEAKTITFVSANQAVVKFYDKDANDYAEATVAVTIEENRKLVSVDDSYNHVAFRRNAEVSGAVIAVTCDNKASFVDNYSDNTTESENVNYTIVNNFSYVVPTIITNNIANLLGKSFSFNAGTAAIEGVNVSINFVRREVSAIMHNGKDYRSNAPQCEVVAKTITITSATTAVVRFYDKNAADYAEAILPITVEEQATVVDVERSYAHIAFDQNAVVANNTISVICNNKATQTKIWSNGTSSEADVNYTVTNRFVYTMPSMPVSAKGQSFRFNAGTAVVEGRNVNVNFSSREVSAIMFDGVDYRAEAPVCEVNVATITFGEGTATITFEEGNETIVAVVPVDYLEAEVIGGEIVGAWITDSYQGRTYVSTDLHILAKQADGSYVAYSRNVNETSFTTTALTASEGQGVLSSGRAMAWAVPGTLGSVSYVESDKASTGYVIMYYYLNGSGANILGDAEAALNGKPFAEPVKAIGAVADGMWSISYNGTTYYFISK